MNIPAWQYALSMSLYVIVLMFAVDFMRKHSRFALWFWIAAIFTFPLWPTQLHGWFRWAKTLSVIIPTALIVGPGRIVSLGKSKEKWQFYNKDWVLWSLYAILGLNILEASLKDLSLGNWFNGVSGFILIVTMPLFKSRRTSWRGWEFSEDRGDLIARTDLMWNFLYTTWNICFVFGENPGYAASSLCILLAAELYPLLKKRPELYITARVYTLAIHILIRSTYDIFTPLMDSTRFANQQVVFWWGIANLGLHLPYLFYHFRRQQVRSRAFPLKKSA
ncbi:MAG: DUF5692 family protein [Spirochaetales bacterium]|nr:DUF5692 family protein [Spirochaetales bacterium]